MFPFRRLDSNLSMYRREKVQKKIYRTPFELIKDAKGYMRVGNSIQAREKAYACYSSTIKHLYKHFNLAIDTHNATKFLARLACTCQRGFDSGWVIASADEYVFLNLVMSEKFSWLKI
ncbi:unnamed protein product [Meloidogyne enterolobii]|uniref:Uncharacterized protein n=1 Tax=Meloidogyne enterolobii TaxID=390850 RepID=A0ACB1AUJ9_MELEN